jgi:hypothetical protein
MTIKSCTTDCHDIQKSEASLPGSLSSSDGPWAKYNFGLFSSFTFLKQKVPYNFTPVKNEFILTKAKSIGKN